MAAGLVVGILALVVAACGAPEFTYVKNSGQQTYFKVPHEWHEIDTDSVDDTLSGTNPDSATSKARQKAWWSVAYDASEVPDADHLLSAGTTLQPIVYVRVADLNEPQQNAVSLDMLRNAFLPVTEEARSASAGAALGLSGFELLQDEVLTPEGGLHGVHVVYDYELASGVMHTFDQTALLNTDGSKFYMLIIRCSTSCFRERSSELDTIAKSFTVRS
ncbi:hypothetical protein KOI35_28325 [Actinoplanes bogorensis]|uniref:Lipoprotein LpqN n=1 Tax=Paractinoplanes bogorensis TaxID=1610840 RepID=A0ABS5YVE9_9ACTN|nr:hypothetical protein [Actinoplanes bogorensis]MBU2667424.1 hypothetical protein [Actinoplanes bogorensis]